MENPKTNIIKKIEAAQWWRYGLHTYVTLLQVLIKLLQVVMLGATTHPVTLPVRLPLPLCSQLKLKSFLHSQLKLKLSRQGCSNKSCFRRRSLRTYFAAKVDNDNGHHHLDSDLPFLLRMERLWSRGFSGASALIEHLTQYGVIKSKKVAEVMQKIDRGLFVPPGNSPYLDSPMPIGYNATISAPHMHATCLELLEAHLQPGMRALDVGSGTGYLTACFAVMVGPQGHAVGIEHIPELVSMSVENVRKSAAASLLENGSLSFHIGDGRQGWPDLAPYDAIHVGAAASEIPKPLIEQLKPGGRMVIPVGDVFQDLQVIDKKADGTLQVHTETSVRYVPLTSREKQLRSY